MPGVWRGGRPLTWVDLGRPWALLDPGLDGYDETIDDNPVDPTPAEDLIEPPTTDHRLDGA